MRKTVGLLLLVLLSGPLAAQTIDRAGNASRSVFEGRPAVLRLAPHVTTTIRLPEPVNAVVVGDSTLFQAEYDPNEPLTVFVKPVVPGLVESNLVISTTGGRQFVFLLRNIGTRADGATSAPDLVVTGRLAGGFFVDETFPSTLISETLDIESVVAPSGESGSGFDDEATGAVPEGSRLEDLVHRQAQRRLQDLQGDRIQVGIGEVMEVGSLLVVSFSVVNSGSEGIELVTPQVQLAGQTTSGIFRRTRWNAVQQIPVEFHQITRRRLAPRERADGAVAFERPAIKQSTEQLLLQIADSAAVDQPTLTPISFRPTSPDGGQ